MDITYKLPKRYKIEYQIGKGGMGEVYKIFDSNLNKFLALKILSRTDSTILHKFKKEFRTLSKLDHPNLVKVYDFSIIASEIPFFTMDFINGEDLCSHLKIRKNLINIYQLIDQCLSALYYLHRSGVLHCDIKPENILIEKTNSNNLLVKILDFGLIKFLKNKKLSINGTIKFIAPEVLISKNYTPASDIYSFGLSIIESITQKNFPISSYSNDFFLAETYACLSKIFLEAGIHAPESLTEFLLKLIQSDLEIRPQSINDTIHLFSIFSEKKPEPIKTINFPYIERKNYLNSIESFILCKNYTNKLLILSGEQGVGKKSIIKKATITAQLNEYLVFNISPEEFKYNSIERFISLLSLNLTANQKHKLFERHNTILNFIKTKDHSLKQDDTLLLFDNIAQFLHELSSFQNILIILYDFELHSDDFIKFIYRIIYETDYFHSNIKFIISRNTDISISCFKKDFYLKLDKYQISSMLYIKPFSIGETEDLINLTFGKQILTSKDIIQLHKICSGRPLFLVDLLNHFIFLNIISYDGERWYYDRKKIKYSLLPRSYSEYFEIKYKEIKKEELQILKYITLWDQAISFYNLSIFTSYNHRMLKKCINNLLNKGMLSLDVNNNIFISNYIYSVSLNNIITSKEKKYLSLKLARFLEVNDPQDYTRIARYYINAKSIRKATKYGIISAKNMFDKTEYYDSYNLLIKLLDLLRSSNDNIKVFKVLHILSQVKIKIGLIKEAKKDLIKLSNHTKDSSLKAFYFKNLAQIYDNFFGNEEFARDTYKKALISADKSNNIEIKINILLAMGNYYGEECKKYLIKAADLSKDKFISYYAVALSRLLYNYKLSGNINELKVVKEEVVTLIDKVDHQAKREIFYNLYLISYYAGEYDKAKEYIKSIIKIDELSNNEFGKIKNFTSLGGLYFIKGDISNQIESLKTALSLSNKFSTYLTSLTIYSNLALAYLFFAEYREVLRIIKKADIIIREHKITEIPPYYYTKPARLYLMLGDKTQHLFNRHIDLSKGIAETTNNSIITGHILLMKSQYFYFRLDLKQAKEFAYKALKIFKSINDKDDIVDTLSQLSLYLTEQDYLDEAEKIINIAKNIYKEINCDYLKPNLLLAEGFLLVKKLEPNTEDVLSHALKAANKMRVREIIWQVYRQFAIYFKKFGNTSKSLYYYRNSINTIKQITEFIDENDIKESYLSLPYRNRIFTEIKDLKNEF